LRSQIDTSIPPFEYATTQGVRNNFAAAASEIDQALNGLDARLPLVGGNLSGAAAFNMQVSPPVAVGRSPGARLVLFQSTTTAEIAIGVAGSLCWFGVRGPADSFAWYSGVNEMARLSGSGDLILSGGLVATGGVLSGQLTIPTTPVLAAHAANKGYVDSRTTNFFLALTGGALSGSLALQLNTAPANPTAIRTLHITGADNENPGFTMDAFGTAPTVFPYFLGRRARGTNANKAAVQAGDYLAGFGGHGSDGLTFRSTEAASGEMDIVASETWTPAANGTQIEFYTTPNGAIGEVLAGTFSERGLDAPGLALAGAPVEIGPPDSAGTGWRALRIAN
jgi:hypothetical protein